MSYQVLARKWRPAQFADVVGQAHVVSALSNALDQDRVHHAFLFTGTRGVGKTTLARIFAKALNCEKGVSSTPCGECAACVAVAEGRFIDLIEVDAASRTRVDDTRELLENVQYAPTQGRYKVYLIDEVHMLSAHSFNALLKTLEEPPEHVKFLLATTDPQKLPMTVLSRCIQFSLNAIEPQDIDNQLSMILHSESIHFEAGALSLLARAADGSLRDALSLLDQGIAYSDRELTETSIREMLGLVDGQTVVAIIDALARNDAATLLQCSSRLVHASQDLKTALDDLLSYFHALALYQFAPDAIEWKGLVREDIERLSKALSPEILQLYYQITLNGKRDFMLAPDSRTGFEMVLLRLMAFKPGEGLQSASASTGSAQKQTADRSVQGDASVRKVAPAGMPNQVLNEAGSDKTGNVPGKISEEMQPFLEDGLQNVDLKRHIKPASAISTPEPVPVEPARETSAGLQETPANLRDQSLYLPDEMLDINSLVENINVWSDFVVKVGLTGMARQLVVHMMPLSFKEGVLNLQLDEKYRSLQSTERIQQISDALQRGSGQKFKINIEFGEVTREHTASGVIAERERSTLEKTRQDFKQDDNVKELVSLFDADIDESSIKPIN
jgi:DNA polymerase-3 subunit gamma/tau